MRRRAAVLLLVAVVAAATAAVALLPRTRRALAARRFHAALTELARTIYLTEAQRQQLRAAGPEQSEPPPFRWQAVWAVPGDRFLTLEGTIAGIVPAATAFYGVTSHVKV